MSELPVLSDRELDIMREVVTGASNREIARTLDISPNTVKVHLRNIYEKLGVASRTEATLSVLRQGLVVVEGVALPEPGYSPLREEELDEEEEEPLSPRPAPSEEQQAARAERLAPADLAPPAPRPEGPLPRTVLVPEVIIPPRPPASPSWVTPVLALTVLLLLALVGVLVLRPATSPAPVSTLSEPNRWQSLAPLPEALSRAVAANVGGTLLLVGGEGPEARVWRYDPARALWTGGAAPAQSVQDAPLAVAGGSLYMAGGVDGSGKPTALVQRYDPLTDAWDDEVPPLPRPLARSALTAFEGELFLFGGWDGEVVQGSVYRYAPGQQEWEAIATLPSPRADLAAATLQEGIVLVGGTDEQGSALDSVLHFDPRAATPFRAAAPLPQPERAPALVALGQALYMMGGQGLLERDPTLVWKSIAPPDATLPEGAALVASDPYIIVLGGQIEEEPVATVWAYQAIFRSFIPIVPNHTD